MDALAKRHSADPDVGDFFSIDFLADFVGFSLLCGCDCDVGEGDGFAISTGALNGMDEVDDDGEEEEGEEEEEEDIAECDFFSSICPYVLPCLAVRV